MSYTLAPGQRICQQARQAMKGVARKLGKDIHPIVERLAGHPALQAKKRSGACEAVPVQAEGAAVKT